MAFAHYLDRMRANAHEALAQGASVPIVAAHLLAVIRHGSRPTSVDHVDALEIAELVEALNEIRKPKPGEAAP